MDEILRLIGYILIGVGGVIVWPLTLYLAKKIFQWCAKKL